MIDFLKNEISSWDHLRQIELPIMIYGMGNGADIVIDRLNKDGLEPAEFFASDDFVRGQQFHGKTVKKLSEIEKQYDDFIIVVAFGSQRPEVMENIINISKKHKLLVPTVPVFGDNIFDSSFVEKNEFGINSSLELFEDEISRNTYINIIKFYYTGKLEYLLECETEKAKAYDIMVLGETEHYLDLGAYRGDTVDEFLQFCNGKYNSITALEPDEKTYNKLIAHCEHLQSFSAIHAAIWNENTKVYFERKGGRMSAVSDKGVELDAVTIDSLAEGTPFSYIKADVEGCEKRALLGGVNTLKELKPKLNIALYHRGEDIFKLPLLINEINPNYKFFIRHHPYIPAWDTNLYCI